MTGFAPIAVVGLGGLFPQAPDLATFQRHILARHDASRDVPPDRWVVNPRDAYDPRLAPDKVYSTRACLVEDFTLDPTGLNLDATTLRGLDPLYQMVLHVGRQALGDASIERLDRRRIGITLAAIALPTDGATAITSAIQGRLFEDTLLGAGTPILRPARLPSPLNAQVTARPASLLAEALELGGGSCTLDAACASSLVAVKLACDTLNAGTTDAMLAGGVSRPDSLYTQMGFCQLRALSPTGVCRPFGADADGLVVGEGAGIVVLKRLQDAHRDGDHIYGVIRGIGLSNDVAGSLLAADSEGQLRAMRAAYDQAAWVPEDIDLIECHGTGTPLGDTTELESLHALWRETSPAPSWRTGQCAVGSVKSNIGHLLTAAGAAGLIKVLLAMRDRSIPPSANVDEGRTNPALTASPDEKDRPTPFRLPTAATAWNRRDQATPRRAAVSGFGFGGINAHLLLEEATAETTPHLKTNAIEGTLRTRTAEIDDPPPPIAIVGMDIHAGRLNSLHAFQEAVLRGDSATGPFPDTRWTSRPDEARNVWGDSPPDGAYIDSASVEVGAVRLPPNEIPETLPQQWLMLQSVTRALTDAGTSRPEHARQTGVIIGMGLDLNTTNFHHRWALLTLARQWAASLDLQLADHQFEEWVASLREESGPALTPGRVLGSLGNIIASRIAREFGFGGASFAISAEEASGIRALDVGLSALRQHELDRVVVGAVDLPGDLRSMLARDVARPYSSRGAVRPFDVAADGTLVGEGAVSLVLKRLTDAVAAGDRVYASIRGLGLAGGNHACPSVNVYVDALERAYTEAKLNPRHVSYVETHGSGHPDEDSAETHALTRFFDTGGDTNATMSCALGSVKPTIGHMGAAAGLTSVLKTALCLYQEIIPPLSGFREPSDPTAWTTTPFYMPLRPAAWLHDRANGPRVAGVSVMTCDGGSGHVVMQGVDRHDVIHAAERRQPLGSRAQAVFGLSAQTTHDLLSRLEALRALTGTVPADTNLESLARRAYADGLSTFTRNHVGLALHTTDLPGLQQALNFAERHLRTNPVIPINGRHGVFYAPAPLGPQGDVAFVFPGSGNHYVGMGTGIGVEWPCVLRNLNTDTAHLHSQFLPQLVAPRRHDWQEGWQEHSERALNEDFLAMLLGQVSHGVVMSDLLRQLGVAPSAAIGYSLGESTALFAMRAWPERDEMYRRMRRSPLFQHELVGRCDAARRAWQLDEHEAVDWRSVVINRPANVVREVIAGIDRAYLQIVNTTNECVVGGQRQAVDTVIARLACEAIDLAGASTVHCTVARSVEEDYRQLHLLDTKPPDGIRFYSAAQQQSYAVNPASAADAILAQAVSGIDFAQTIEQAYADGVRIFVETGPQASCSRMIGKILDGRPHLAQSACVQGEDDTTTVLRLMAALYAEGVLADLGPLYGSPTAACGPHVPLQTETAQRQTPEILIPTGRRAPQPQLPAVQPTPPIRATAVAPPPHRSAPAIGQSSPGTSLAEAVANAASAGAHAHSAFLHYSETAMSGMGRTLAFQARLLGALGVQHVPNAPGIATSPSPDVAYDRDQCLEFAVGSAESVLGPEFAALDRYPVRVRLPDEPLMLVDRILSVDGVKGSMTRGRVVTEHDVRLDAWYLDAARAPVCITVEAGQADLFLCSYLGIDLVVQGTRAYRLLDATVTFHGGLPKPGEVIRYEIHIDRFVRQGDTYLFFFRFEGTLAGRPVLTMEKGCAGFFTEEETQASGGILLSADEQAPRTGRRPDDWQALVAMAEESYDALQVTALRNGDLTGCFGPLFENLGLQEPVRLPGGRMHLVDRVVQISPAGGRFGIGMIRAEADIRGDEWFLTCHFVDDRVMPGTLMYECCLHTLRVFLIRMGWIAEAHEVAYEPLPGTASILRCRGPVTAETQVVSYEVHIKELGYEPAPYAVADALIYADGHRIVQFRDMSVRMTGTTRERIEARWQEARAVERDPTVTPIGTPPVPEDRRPALYENERILAFAIGNPSEAFGAPYRVFDHDRRIARLPGPPFKFLDRITAIHAEAWNLAPDGWIEAQYDVPHDAWYFRANRQASMPFAVILEIALQPCGWLAAYLGSALRSDEDLSFRNLGGTATLYEEIFPTAGTLTVRVRITKVAAAGGMIVQSFDMQVWQAGRITYGGNTQFGFFSAPALAQQVGIRDASERRYTPGADEIGRGRGFALETVVPITPDDPNHTASSAQANLPARALRMVDEIELFVPDGGEAGLGFIRGIKHVDPQDWFFAAHFYQDPVCPGSLGLESFLQLLKLAALDRWGDKVGHTHRFEPIALGREHTWIYRGQIIPDNQRVEVDVVVTEVQESPTPTIFGQGFLSVDGIPIYEIHDFGIRLVP